MLRQYCWIAVVLCVSDFCGKGRPLFSDLPETPDEPHEFVVRTP